MGRRKTSLKLFAAANDGTLDRVRDLLSNGADVNIRDEEGLTPLMAASSSGSIEIVTVNGATSWLRD